LRQHRHATKQGENNTVASKVYSRTFQKAAELAGGNKKLARLLRVPLAELEKWSAGAAEPPLPVFLKAIDLVLDETAPPGGLSEPAEPEPPRECAAGGPPSLLL
jgi:hypothetical protein